MADLSGWNMKQAYTGQQAAALVFGLDPKSDALRATAGLLQRMKDAYAATLWAHQASVVPLIEKLLPRSVRALFPSIEVDRDPFDTKFLHSWHMTEYYDEVGNRTDIETGDADLLSVAADHRFSQWLLDDQKTDFAEQLFDPHELHIWLRNSELGSKFEFFPRATQVVSCSVETIVSSRTVKSRRSILDSAIDEAKLRCRDADDAVQVWYQLREMALNELPPLLAVEEKGIVYTDPNNQRKLLSLRALKMRLHRAR